jgi:hypothetical protein
LEYLNLSISTCAPIIDSHSLLGKVTLTDIEFAIDISRGYLRSSRSSILFDPGETFIVRFASAYKKGYHSALSAFIGPIGWNVFMTTALMAALMVLLLWVTLYCTSRLYHCRHIPIVSVVSVVYRPLLDQCEEKRLPSQSHYFRIILITWLCYCLLITETYRSELISHMTKPLTKYWMDTFDELANASGSTIKFFRERNGEQSSTLYILSAQTISKIERRRRIFNAIGSRFERYQLENKTQAEEDNEIEEGIAVFLGDSFILSIFAKVSATKLNAWFYRTSSEGIKTEVFWSVRYGPNQNSILETLKWLKEYGILSWFRKQQDSVDAVLIKRFVKRTFFKNPLDLDYDVRSKDETLKFKHVKALLLVLIGGLSLGSVLWIGEQLHMFKCTKPFIFKEKVSFLILYCRYRIQKFLENTFQLINIKIGNVYTHLVGKLFETFTNGTERI